MNGCAPAEHELQRRGHDVSAGYAVFTQTARSVGNDMRLEHEIALLDVAAGIYLLKDAI